MPTSRRHVMRFVMLFPGRSGSTYVISALDAHPAILAKAEVLDPMRPEGAPIQGSTLKNTSEDLREVVTNFDELRARYAGTPCEAMFDEVLVP